jgi:hypothetical protein
MSESTKLKYLLNKVSPRIQFEVRRKKPTSAKQFLEYAKEIEELLKLTNIDPMIDNEKPSQINQLTSSITHLNTAAPSANSYIPSLLPPKSSNKNLHVYNRAPNFNPRHLHQSMGPDTSSHTTNTSTKPPQYLSNKSRPNNHHNNNFSTSGVQVRTNYSDNSRDNNNNRRHYRVNNITSSDEHTTPDTSLSAPNSDFCSRCNRQGHMASACDRF